MKISEMLESAKDFYRPNEYSLEEYIIKDDKTHPFVLIIPGGGYGIVCSFVEGMPIAKEWNKKGYNAFVLFYHVRKKAKYPAPLEDCVKAVKEITDNKDKYHVTDEYIIMGSSAGGHLTGMYLREDIGYKKHSLPKPKAAILVYPVVSLNDPTHVGTRTYILGKNHTKEEKDFLSLDKHITEDFPPTYFWCGDKDDVVDPIHAVELDKIMTEKGIKHQFHLFHDVGHGVGLAKGTNAETWFEEANNFINSL